MAKQQRTAPTEVLYVGERPWALLEIGADGALELKASRGWPTGRATSRAFRRAAREIRSVDEARDARNAAKTVV